MNVADLCYAVGWVYRPTFASARSERRRPGCIKPDTARVRRVFDHQDYVTYETGLRLCKALGMDPYEAGI